MFALARKLLLLVLGLPFVILGARFLFDSTNTALTHWSSATWPTTTGKLLFVEQHADQDQAWGNQTVVRYHYEVDGEIFTGTALCAAQACPDQTIFDQLYTDWINNQGVPVLVHPTRPAQAMLYRHLHLPYFLLNLSVGLFCLFTGGSALIFALYMLRQDRVRSGGSV